MHRVLEQLEPRYLLATGGPTVFGVIGDYGLAGPAEEDVADLIKSWNPDAIVTVGDNNYPDGEASTIDPNIGQYFHEYIFNYQGIYGPGSPTRRFLPALGNHDWDSPTGAQPYLNYFDLPGNERYYDIAVGPVRFFILDSDPREPDGVSSNSVQGQWLQAALAAATEPYKVVLAHHSPYSSGGENGSSSYMRWPFAQWGATTVLGGHDHVYERLNVSGFPYFVNGVGGHSIDHLNPPMAGSELQFNGDFGAMRGEADDTRLRLKFYTRSGALIDTYTINAAAPQPPRITLAATDPSGSESGDPIVYTFSRTGDAADPLTVNFTLSGTASGGLDYSIPTSIAFAAGAATTTLTVNPVDDAILEANETIIVTLAPDDSYNMGAARAATGTITDTDVLTTLLPLGSVWKYLDDGSDQGTAWSQPVFDDSTWDSGPAQLGYGDGDEATVINSGPAGNFFITYYFRTTFTVADPTKVGQLRLRLVRDDGALMYVNGVFLVNNNMPSGPVNHQTTASTNVGGEDESRVYEGDFPPTALVAGTNVLAVEVHQFSPTSSDVSFDAGIQVVIDATPPAVPDAPDLQSASDTGSSSTDNITRDATPTFQGLAESGATVRLFADGVEVGSAIAANGSWTITATSLSDGSRAITVTATDGRGNTSAPSAPLNVVIDTVAPALVLHQFQFDARPMRVAYLLSEAPETDLALEDLLVERLSPPGTVNPSDLALLGSGTSYTLRFPGFASGILPDADYRATLSAAALSDLAGNVAAADQVLEFFFLNGDANRDRQVNLSDFDIMVSNFGLEDRVFSQGDFNYDGRISLPDFNLLAGRFGMSLPEFTRGSSLTSSVSRDRDEWLDDLLR